MTMLVAPDHPPVSQNYLRAEQVVQGQTVGTPEDAVTAAQGDAADTDGRTGAAGHRDTAGGKRLVHLAEARPGAHLRHPSGHHHSAHGAHVDDNAARGGVPGEAVATAARRGGDPVATGEADDLPDVLARRAAHHGPRHRVGEPRHERRARLLVPVVRG
jgi:hypothetical protein